jgi:hypothetical protein
LDLLLKFRPLLFAIAFLCFWAFIILEQASIESSFAESVVCEGKETTMLRVDPESSSIIIRATHIVLVRIETAQVGQWIPSLDNELLKQRTVDLTLKIREILKGKIKEDPGEQIALQVNQYDTRISRKFAVPGVWSYQSIDPGSDILLFCRHSGDRGADIFQEASCEQVFSAAMVIEDARLALKAEAEDKSLDDLLVEAGLKAGSLGDMFSGYLWAREGDRVFKDREAFDILMKFLERVDLSPTFRSALLDSVDADISSSGTVTDWHVYRLVVAMFRLLGIKEAADTHFDIIDLYLPNRLGLAGGGGIKRTADEVFGEYPGEREKAKKLLQDYRGEASTDSLIEWLR